MPASYKPMVVTAALVGAVLIIDDATTTPGTAPAQPTAPTTSTPSTPPATTAAALPHRDTRGVIQTMGDQSASVALTFDDGPSPTYTPQVLDILAEHDVPATFCLVGTNAIAHPELVQEIVDGGHTLCNHTVTHDMNLPNRDVEQIRREIAGAQDAIAAAVPGTEVPFYRAPGGAFAPNVQAVAMEYQLESLGWSLDPRDWAAPGAEAIRAAVVDGVIPGSIVLLHDGGGDQSGTVAALEGIIVALREAGYEFVVPTM
jgi:peptidoglycan-N-acetylglucosamine deacetylase